MDINDRIKPIETKYNGFIFRSRLEARWAVFFDALGIEWEYEKEGYKLDSFAYLPDFWLPQHKYWLEVKGVTPTTEEIQKCQLLQDFTGYPVILVMGQPHLNKNFAYYCESGDSGGGYGETENARWFLCSVCRSPDLNITDRSRNQVVNSETWQIVGGCYCELTKKLFLHERIVKAYHKAKSARFEFKRNA